MSGVKLAIFDILRGNEWLPWQVTQDIAQVWGLPWAPVVYRGPFEEGKLRELSEGNSLIPNANHIREGIVVKPVIERTDLEVGRAQLKMISNAYLEKN